MRFSLEKSVLDDFDEVCKNKGYSNRNKALVDMIKNEIKENRT